MGLNLSLVSSDIKQYGAPLYALVQELGGFNASEVTVVDANTFMNDGYYIRIRQSAIDAGHDTSDASYVFTAGEFEAVRDASGEDGPNGAWSIAKGKRVLLAW
jgi:hypothetical protein